MRKEIAPRVFAEELERHLFVILVRLDSGRYEVLNDLNHVEWIEAGSDSEAVSIFNERSARGEYRI